MSRREFVESARLQFFAAIRDFINASSRPRERPGLVQVSHRPRKAVVINERAPVGEENGPIVRIQL